MQLRKCSSGLLAGLALLLSVGISHAQVMPFATALDQTLSGLRTTDPNFPAHAQAIATRLASAPPQSFENVIREANFVAGGFQPTQQGLEWIRSFSTLLAEQKAGRVGAAPADFVKVVVQALNQTAAPVAAARAGEFAVSGPAPDEEIVQRLADRLIASEVFRRDVRFTDTAKAFIAELSKMLPLIGTKYRPDDIGQPFADEVVQHLEQTVIANVEGERMKNEWRATYNAFMQNVKNHQYGQFGGTVADWKLAIERVIRAMQKVVEVGGTLPPNPFVAGAAPVGGAAAVAGTGGYGGPWYSHAAVKHERKMSRIIGRNEVRRLRVQSYRGY